MPNLQRNHSKVIGFLLASITLIGSFFIITKFQGNNTSNMATAIPEASKVTVNGITMELITAHTEGTNYRVEVCYTLPSQQDWLLSSPNTPQSTYLSFPGVNVSVNEEGTMYWRYDTEGNAIKRCQYLLFIAVIPEVQQLSLTVNSLFARKIAQPDSCFEIRQEMGERGYSLTFDCASVKGIEGHVYVRFPVETLFMDPIYRNIIKEMKSDQHAGSWVFTFPVNPP